MTGARRAATLGALASFGAVALALVLQHGFAMEPCSWCVVQRLFYLVAGAFFLLAAVPVPRVAAIGALLAADLAATFGLASALFHQFVASKPGACGMTIADRFLMASNLHESVPWLFNPTALCDEANLPLLGVPFAVWSVALFAALVLVATCALFATRRGVRPSRARGGY